MGLLLVAALLAAPMALYQPQSASAAAEEKDELHEAMSTIDRSLRTLRRSLRDANKNAESLTTITALQQAVVISKEATPPRAAKTPAGEREAFLKGYRLEMAKLLSETIALEIAVLEGDNTKAQAIYEKIKAMEEPGHQKYAEEGT